jgi:hypothetical protein
VLCAECWPTGSIAPFGNFCDSLKKTVKRNFHGRNIVHGNGDKEIGEGGGVQAEKKETDGQDAV